jgi:hypothetical protein
MHAVIPKPLLGSRERSHHCYVCPYTVAWKQFVGSHEVDGGSNGNHLQDKNENEKGRNILNAMGSSKQVSKRQRQQHALQDRVSGNENSRSIGQLHTLARKKMPLTSYK